VPIVLKSGSLNLLEPSGPVQACNGIALTFTNKGSVTGLGRYLDKGKCKWFNKVKDINNRCT
jgi:hypothetical protein